MEITKKDFGVTKDGKQVFLYEIKNSKGASLVVSNYGAVIVKIIVPDKDGNLKDVVLGYDKVSDYEGNSSAHGAVVGRSANRIEKARFTLNGEVIELEVNDRGNNLHSGSNSYYNRVYDEVSIDEESGSITFKLISPDGDQNMPGELTFYMTYSFSEEMEVKLNYKAVSDKDTVINFTNHSYFNLNGHDSGCALDHEIYVNADKFTVADEVAIPHGEERDVTGTDFDFRTPKTPRVGTSSKDPQIAWAKGYDRNFVLNEPSLTKKVAYVKGDKSGIVMEIYTNLPGLQFYAGNYLGVGEVSKDGYEYKDYDGLAFESQFAPNSVNIPSFPQPFFKAGEEYNYTTIYKFTV